MSTPDAQVFLWRPMHSSLSLERWGGRLARHLSIGDAVCLSGPLGAGKSTLARGLIRALTTPDEDVPSPTFTLVQLYETLAFPLAHFDLYRLVRPEDAFELGIDEALEAGVAIIEWPERLQGRLPPDRLDIEIAFIGEAARGRRLRSTPRGSWRGRACLLEGLGAAADQGLDEHADV